MKLALTQEELKVSQLKCGRAIAARIAESRRREPPQTKPPQTHTNKQASKKLPVAVTGASGYIAAHCVARLLAAGYTVHGTVRSVAAATTGSGAFLMSLPGAAERLKLFEADLLLSGSFEAALKGCGAVLHTASPFVSAVKPGTERQVFVEPALRGTENVLGESFCVCGDVLSPFVFLSDAQLGDALSPLHLMFFRASITPTNSKTNATTPTNNKQTPFQNRRPWRGWCSLRRSPRSRRTRPPTAARSPRTT